MTVQGDHPDGVRVWVAARPASVPAARRMVDESLRVWDREQLVDDVSLCVTERSTDATLYGGTRFEVEVSLNPGTVRISVLDNGAEPAEAIAARTDFTLTDPDLLDDLDRDLAGTTADIVHRHAVTWDAARLRKAVEQVERRSHDGELMTLPAADPVQRLRDWMEDQIVGRAEHDRSATAFATWVSRHGLA